MGSISRFGIRKLRTVVPSEFKNEISHSPSSASGNIPSGDLGTPGERNDMILSGQFRERFEHLTRYSEVARVRWGFVVDVGCGTGYGSALLGLKNEVLGIDVSGDALRYASSRYGGPSCILGSGEALPLASSSADTVTAFEVIEHAKNPEKVLDECNRVLKKGGMLFLSSPNPAHFGNILKHIFLMKPIPDKINPNNIYHNREFPYKEMCRLLSAKGFELVWAKGQTIPIDFGLTPGRLLRALGLLDIYEWLLSRTGEKLPRLSFTVVYASRRM